LHAGARCDEPYGTFGVPDLCTCQTEAVADQSFPIIYHIDEHGAARVSLVGEFDADNHVALRHYLLGIVHDQAVAQVLIDMRATTFIDSNAVRVFESSRAAAEAENKLLHVVNPTPAVRRIFEILEMRDMLANESPTPRPCGE
jgi:anti-anti-sigma factor